MVTFLDDTVYLGLLAGGLTFTVWTFFSMRDWGDDPSPTTNRVSSSLTDTSDLTKTIADLSRFFSLFSVIFLGAFSICFWMILGIYTIASSYPIWAVDLGVFYFILGIIMLVALILYWILYSTAFLKNRLADFRPR